MSSVVGSLFELTKTCDAHGSSPGMFAVVQEYKSNSGKGNRVEAHLYFFEASQKESAEEMASIVKAMSISADAAADEDA
eukprot:7376096-Prymnesium_polylepis.1